MLLYELLFYIKIIRTSILQMFYELKNYGRYRDSEIYKLISHLYA